MFEAYSESRVAYKLPLEIQSVAAKGAKVLVGTKNGSLLNYEPNHEGKRQYEVQMSKSFSKKSVTQLKAFEKHNLLVCLSDNIITIYDMIQGSYVTIDTLQKTKGANMFTVWNDHENDNIYLCVIIRKKMLFYQFKHETNEFNEMSQPLDFAFPDSIQTACWCGHSVAVAVRDEYFLVTVLPTNERDTDRLGVVKQLFTSGNRSIDPVIVPLIDRKLVGFCRDETMYFVTLNGNIAPRDYKEIPWSEVPTDIVYDSPYLVGLLSKHIEIRSVKPSFCVQIINFPRVKFISWSLSGQVFIASSHDIWCLSSGPNLKLNIQQLIRDKQYDLAIQLAEQSKEDKEEEKEKRILDIKHLYAFHLFCQRRFSEAFDLCSQIESEVLYVIGFFPDLLPDDIRQNISYPDRIPNNLTEDELKMGYQALTKYLSEIRTKIARALQMQPKLKEKLTKEEKSQILLTDVERQLLLTDAEMIQNRNVLQIVDTTLLKCYLETNDMLVASLLRLKDNSCNVIETEKILRKKNKFFELFILYERKSMHAEALRLLRDQAKIQNSPLRGLERTVHYLQNLGQSHIDLILMYASWVLNENPEEGLKIFIEECDEVKELDRERILNFLMREMPSIVIDYLEHIILQWDEERPKFHDILTEHYVIKVKRLMNEYVQSLPEGHDVLPAGQEPGELGRCRTRLLYFLEISLKYSPELLLVQIPHDSLYEERALLLGRLKRHNQSIAIYTNILHDYKAAERYCNLHYNKDNTEDAKVYLLLLRMYALPPDNSILGLMHSGVPRPQPNVAQALRVLKDYAHRIDTVEGIEYLSPDIRLDELWIALEAVLQETANRRHKIELHKGLFYASKLRTNGIRMKAENIKLTIDYGSGCSRCHKKIGNSAFARFSDGSLVHYYCYKQSDVKQKISIR